MGVEEAEETEAEEPNRGEVALIKEVIGAEFQRVKPLEVVVDLLSPTRRRFRNLSTLFFFFHFSFSRFQQRRRERWFFIFLSRHPLFGFWGLVDCLGWGLRFEFWPGSGAWEFGIQAYGPMFKPNYEMATESIYRMGNKRKTFDNRKLDIWQSLNGS